jgi:hypothetical protein
MTFEPLSQQEWDEFVTDLDIELFCERFSVGPTTVMGSAKSREQLTGVSYEAAGSTCGKLRWFNANTPGYICLWYCFGGQDDTSAYYLEIRNDDHTVAKDSEMKPVKGRTPKSGNPFAIHGWLGHDAFEELCAMVQAKIDARG